MCGSRLVGLSVTMVTKLPPALPGAKTTGVALAPAIGLPAADVPVRVAVVTGTVAVRPDVPAAVPADLAALLPLLELQPAAVSTLLPSTISPPRTACLRERRRLSQAELPTAA